MESLLSSMIQTSRQTIGTLNEKFDSQDCDDTFRLISVFSSMIKPMK